MALNNSNEAVVIKRREHVAELLLNGKTQRQIMEAIPKLMDGQEFSLGTINGDIKAIKAAWRRNATKKVDLFIAKQNAVVESVIDALLPNKGNPRHAEVLLQALKRQSELFGLDKPTKVENSGSLTITVVYENDSSADSQ